MRQGWIGNEQKVLYMPVEGIWTDQSARHPPGLLFVPRTSL